VSFFDPPPPPPPAPVPPPQPEWLGPGPGDLPGFVPIQATLWRDGEVAVVVRGIEAYRTGVSFELSVMVRQGPLEHLGMMMARHADPAGALRIGVALADGRRASIDDQFHHPLAFGEPPPGPVLMFRGSQSQGLNRMDVQLWLWPLPPPGELTLGVVWRSRGIPETLHVLDAAVIREAAGRAEHLWDPIPGDPFSGRMGFGGGAVMGVATAVAQPPPEPPDPDRPPAVSGEGPADLVAEASSVVVAFRRVHGTGPIEEAAAGVDDGADLVESFAALRERATRFAESVVVVEAVHFLDADHAVLRWVVHGTTPMPRRLDARLVRTPDGWRIRRASVLHVFRLAGVPAPPD
jgi:hypothetical protein